MTVAHHFGRAAAAALDAYREAHGLPVRGGRVWLAQALGWEKARVTRLFHQRRAEPQTVARVAAAIGLEPTALDPAWTRRSVECPHCGRWFEVTPE